MKKTLPVLFLMLTTPMSFGSQLTISNVSFSAESQVNLSAQLNTSRNAPITFTASTTDTSPYEGDTLASQCLETDLAVVDGSMLNQKIHIGDTLPASIGGTITVHGTVKKTCDSSIMTYLWLYDVLQNGVHGFFQRIDMPSFTTCSTTVNDNIDFENVYPGSEEISFALTSDTLGKGALTFTPNYFDFDSGFLKNNSALLHYSVSDTDWQVGSWKGDLSDHNLILQAVPKNAAAGVYKGILTVTIACE